MTRWTEAEDQAITARLAEAEWNAADWRGIAAELPGRSAVAVRQRAYRLRQRLRPAPVRLCGSCRWFAPAKAGQYGECHLNPIYQRMDGKADWCSHHQPMPRPQPIQRPPED